MAGKIWTAQERQTREPVDRLSALPPQHFTRRVEQAIEDGEFTLVFQPQADVRTGQITGCEALSRWQLPDGTRLPPAMFISKAEDGEAIFRIGDWSLRKACQQMADWKGAFQVELTVSVNLSARQLTQPGLIMKIADILAETGLPARQLILELTETSLLDHDPVVTKTLTALCGLGVGLELDDFGTGYASLALLTKLPLTALKIDKSFVQHMPGSRQSAIIVQYVIRLAHDLNLCVVAEGVETSEQRLYLHAYGCDRMQGYWLAPPLAPERLSEMFHPRNHCNQ